MKLLLMFGATRQATIHPQSNALRIRRSRRVRGALCIVAAPGALTFFPGCSHSSAPPAIVTPEVPLKNVRPVAVDPQVEARNKKAVAIWSKAVRDWVSGVTQAPGQSGAAGQQVVTINVAALASHHPAWRLADALERLKGVSVNAALPPAAQRAPIMPFGPLSITAPGGVAGYAQDARSLPAGGLLIRQSAARRRQQGALNPFLEAAAERSARGLAERESMLRAALGEDVAAVRRLSLDELDPTLLSDAERLELTNLNLQILDALKHVDKEPARRELIRLQEEWQATLLRQAAARRAELNRLGEQRPRDQQTLGEQQIAATLSQSRQQGEAALQTAARSHAERLASDFSSDAPRLAIGLPGAFVPPQHWIGGNAKTGSRLSQTPSAAPGLALASGSGQTLSAPGRTSGLGATSKMDNGGTLRDQVRVLRSQAWRDAGQWAQIAARRGGWMLAKTPNAADVPDRTREALRILNLS